MSRHLKLDRELLKRALFAGISRADLAPIIGCTPVGLWANKTYREIHAEVKAELTKDREGALAAIQADVAAKLGTPAAWFYDDRPKEDKSANS